MRFIYVLLITILIPSLLCAQQVLPSHYLALKIKRNGIQDNTWNGGHGLALTLPSPPFDKEISDSIMDERRRLINASSNPFGVIGFNNNGTYDSDYSGFMSSNIIHENLKTIENTHVALGASKSGQRREIFIAGTAVNTADNRIGIIVARLYSTEDPSNRHLFGENGLVLLRSDQIAPTANRLKLLGLYATPTNPTNKLRLVILAKTNNATRAYIVALLSNGLIDTSFGQNGIQLLDTRGNVDFDTARLTRSQHQVVSRRDFYLSWTTTIGFSSIINVRKFFFPDGNLDPNSRPISLRVEIGKVDKHYVSINNSRMAIVSSIPQAKKSAYHIGIFSSSDGSPDIAFSGDGRRYFVRNFPTQLKLRAIAFANDQKLYFIERSNRQPDNEIVISRRLMDNSNQGALDNTYGINSQIQVNKNMIRTPNGNILNTPVKLNATNAFIEELTNDHILVITGSVGAIYEP